MEESAEEVARRDDLLRVYNSTKESLKLIEDIARGKMIDTASMPTQPQYGGSSQSSLDTLMSLQMPTSSNNK